MDQTDNVIEVSIEQENGENNFPLELPEHHMVPSSRRKDTRLPYFSGEKNTIPFGEWWIRFPAVSKVND